MKAVLNLKTARDKCPPVTQDPDKTKFKVGSMVLLNSCAPACVFDTKCKPIFRICKQISDKVFDVQDSAGKAGCVSIQILQLLQLAEHVLTCLPDTTSFRGTMKYINHPSLMPNVV